MKQPYNRRKQTFGQSHKKILDFNSLLYSGLVAVRAKDLKRERLEKKNGRGFMIGETVSSLTVAATKHEFHSSNTFELSHVVSTLIYCSENLLAK